MIHFLTSVHGTEDHIRASVLLKLQTKFIKRYVPDSYIWACVEGPRALVDRATGSCHKVFSMEDIAVPETPDHNLGFKLDHLAARVKSEVDANDILVFIDSDAWPAAETFALRLHSLLSSFRVVYLKDRVVNCPSHVFLAVSVEDWYSTGQTWEPMLIEKQHDHFKVGGTVYSKKEPVVGGTLDYIMAHPGIAVEIRVNEDPFDPDFYCTYGDNLGPLIYHHGGGSSKTGIPEYEKLKAEHLLVSGLCGAGDSYEPQRVAAATHKKLSAKVLNSILKSDMEKWGVPHGTVQPLLSNF